jgi:hypothetical protein
MPTFPHILSKLDAKKFLESTDGKILSRARVQRDALAEELAFMANTDDAADWIQSMVCQDEWKTSSCYGLLNYFQGSHAWDMCDMVEGFRLLCEAVARLERATLHSLTH